MAVLLKHLVKRNDVIQYPEVKQDLSPRTRGVIALKEENCTVCMLCARECPDWCIYIDSHKETLPPKREGGRPRKRNVLDRFAIDYALCMYCGICVEVCPYDALFWSREFEYAEYDIRQLTHEKEKLSDWMSTVLPPIELEDGADIPGQPTNARPAASAAPTATPTEPATAASPANVTSSAAEARPEQAQTAPKEGTAATTAARPAESAPDASTGPAPETAKEAPGLAEEVKEQQMDSAAVPTAEPEVKRDSEGSVEEEGAQAEVEAKAEPETPSAPESTAVTQTPSTPAPAPAPSRPAPKLEDLEAAEDAYGRVLDEQTKAGSSPQVAEARAKVARVKAERALTQARAAVPQEAAPAPEPSGAPEAAEPQPEQGPVAPTEEEKDEAVKSEAPDEEEKPEASAPQAEASSDGEDPEAVFERVLEEERAKGSSDAVATARAKAARMRARKGTKGPND
jgi:formate hydrogenlyase subunit 6/NADH:ubiquinone oxidoreductase subunit I